VFEVACLGNRALLKKQIFGEPIFKSGAWAKCCGGFCEGSALIGGRSQGELCGKERARGISGVGEQIAGWHLQIGRSCCNALPARRCLRGLELRLGFGAGLAAQKHDGGCTDGCDLEEHGCSGEAPLQRFSVSFLVLFDFLELLLLLFLLLLLLFLLFLLLLSSSSFSAGLVVVRVLDFELELDEDFLGGLVVALP
jgi:hypothetical protein